MSVGETVGVTLGDVVAARERLKDVLDVTPVLAPGALADVANRRVEVKCENLQRTGSFKIRGALNALLNLGPDELKRGVVADSSGNFGLGLAWASRLLGVKAAIVMPSDATATKRRRAIEMGASVHLSPPGLAERTRVAEELTRVTGAVLVSSHDDTHVIAGQGTVALEIVEQTSPPELVLVPVGGGGLISGIAIVMKAIWPTVRIVGVQPSGAADAARSKAQGRRVNESRPWSIAGGLLVNLGLRNWAVIDALVDEVLVVTDEEIVRAMRLVWERANLVVEPSAAVSVAALLSVECRSTLGTGSALAVLSGGNVDLDDFPWAHASTTGCKAA